MTNPTATEAGPFYVVYTDDEGQAPIVTGPYASRDSAWGSIKEDYEDCHDEDETWDRYLADIADYEVGVKIEDDVSTMWIVTMNNPTGR